MQLLTVYDHIILQQYFEKKPKSSKEDKARAAKMHEMICKIVDGLVNHRMIPE